MKKTKKQVLANVASLKKIAGQLARIQGKREKGVPLSATDRRVLLRILIESADDAAERQAWVDLAKRDAKKSKAKKTVKAKRAKKATP